MKILAIWERPQADPKLGGTFCLDTEGHLLYLTTVVDYAGTDRDGKALYTETGLPEWSPAFRVEDRFDFREAARWLKPFGAELRWRAR